MIMNFQIFEILTMNFQIFDILIMSFQIFDILIMNFKVFIDFICEISKISSLKKSAWKFSLEFSPRKYVLSGNFV